MELELSFAKKEDLLDILSYEYEMYEEDVEEVIAAIERKTNELLSEPELEEYLVGLDSEELQEKFDEVVEAGTEEYLNRADAKDEDIQDYVNSTLVAQRIAYVFSITDQHTFDILVGKVNAQNEVDKRTIKQAKEDNPSVFPDTRSINKLYK